MQVLLEHDKAGPIYERAIGLSISKDFVDAKNIKGETIDKQNSEQHNRRRELLAVERQANKDKIIKEHGIHHFKAQIMEKFLSKVDARVHNEFDNKEKLFTSVLSIEDAAPDILEILAVKAASINRISPLVRSLPWLTDELVTLVNKPQYRKRADVQVSDPNLALSYIGLDNLKLVMPTFMLKHWLPISTVPFSPMKRKLWNDSLSIALATQVLAKEEGMDPFFAFAAGMFSNIGTLAVTRCFLQTYNEMHKQELKEAYDNRDKKLHDTLVEFDMSPELLHQQLLMRSTQVAADVVELMRFDRLHITESIFDVAYGTDVNKMSPLAQLIVKAKAYVAFRNLAKDDLIDKEEAKTLLAAAKVRTADVNLLKKSDIDHIKLSFK